MTVTEVVCQSCAASQTWAFRRPSLTTIDVSSQGRRACGPLGGEGNPQRLATPFCYRPNSLTEALEEPKLLSYVLATFSLF